MLTILLTVCVVFYAVVLLVWLVVALLGGLFRLSDSLSRGSTICARYFYPEYTIPLLLGLVPFVWLAVALLR